MNVDIPTQKERLKVLLCCYACDPYRGSECGTGWHFLRLIARMHDVHVVVQKDYQAPLERYGREHPEEMRHITFHFIYKKPHPFLLKYWPPSFYWFYREWQKRAYKLAVQLHEQEHFDLAHYVNMVGFREPGFFWKLPIPFIWGPIGGMNHTSWRLLSCLGCKGALRYACRNILNAFQKRYSEAARVVSRRAHTIFATDPTVISEIERLWHRKALSMREVGVDEVAEHAAISRHEVGEPLRICWCGVHEPRKGLNVLLRALPLCKQPMEVCVLGKGPCTGEWKRLAERLGVSDKVQFHGNVPHHQVFDLMQACHVFAFPSLAEGGTPNVVMEALKQGLPIICLDHCAFASVVNENCGVKIPVTSLSRITQEMAAHLDRLSLDEDERLRLAHGAQEHSLDFLWDKRAPLIDEVYRRAVRDFKQS